MKQKKMTKKLTAAALCISLAGTGSVGLYPAFTALAANYEKTDGNYYLPDGTLLEGVIARGIDVSRWQNVIDWNAVANDDVDFVMLGTRSRGAVDPYFHANVKGASDAGIRVGAYIYSTATTPQMAVEEADFVLNLVKDYPISFPIAFDAEDSATLGTLPPAQVSEIINAFCKRVEDAGYYPIVYANDNWLSNKIDLSRMHYPVWVARYDKMHAFADPIMWQVSSSGSVNGIHTNVDIDFLYKDLTPYLPGNLWRTIGDKSYYYKDYVMQKDAWIDDGTGWFYMNDEGLASTGWLTKAGLSYYLEPDSGRMVTGWKEVDGKKYNFNGSGAMMTGWVNDSGAWYYMAADGSMSTGWIEAGGSRYYLEEAVGSVSTNAPGAPVAAPGTETAGRMVTGWRQLDQKWYFFDRGSGVMATGWVDDNGARYHLGTDGVMSAGWLTDGAAKYYLSDSGAAAVGWLSLDNSWYFFEPDGAMASGWIHPDDNWYYLGTDGKMAAGWATLDGKTYYLSPSSGRMITGWREVDGAWYYFDGSGAMMTGLTDIGGKIYYLNPADGKMAVSTVLDFDGVEYAADENGVCALVAEETGGEDSPEGETASEEGTAPETVPEETKAEERGPGV